MRTVTYTTRNWENKTTRLKMRHLGIAEEQKGILVHVMCGVIALLLSGIQRFEINHDRLL
jgi:hypothetical protein